LESKHARSGVEAKEEDEEEMEEGGNGVPLAFVCVFNSWWLVGRQGHL
jgi:hypothetical protein